MEKGPYRKCGVYHCNELVSVSSQSRYCSKHRTYTAKENRGSSNDRGYSYKWRGARKRWLALYPLCALCLKRGRIVEATEVHHTDRDAPFWDSSKWQSLCKSCHSGQTVKERISNNRKRVSGNRKPKRAGRSDSLHRAI